MLLQFINNCANTDTTNFDYPAMVSKPHATISLFSTLDSEQKKKKHLRNSCPQQMKKFYWLVFAIWNVFPTMAGLNREYSAPSSVC